MIRSTSSPNLTNLTHKLEPERCGNQLTTSQLTFVPHSFSLPCASTTPSVGSFGSTSMKCRCTEGINRIDLESSIYGFSSMRRVQSETNLQCGIALHSSAHRHVIESLLNGPFGDSKGLPEPFPGSENEFRPNCREKMSTNSSRWRSNSFGRLSRSSSDFSKIIDEIPSPFTIHENSNENGLRFLNSNGPLTSLTKDGISSLRTFSDAPFSHFETPSVNREDEAPPVDGTIHAFHDGEIESSCSRNPGSLSSSQYSPRNGIVYDSMEFPSSAYEDRLSSDSASTSDTSVGNGGKWSGGNGGRSGVKSGGNENMDHNSTDAYYKRALSMDPGHPLLLRNYAKFLHEVLQENEKAEEYYERAILANQGDGEVLAQYAKLLWEFRKDQLRASFYFDQAIKASPQDCYVLAAYASFLWSSEATAPEQYVYPEDDERENSCPYPPYPPEIGIGPFKC